MSLKQVVYSTCAIPSLPHAPVSVCMHGCVYLCACVCVHVCMCTCVYVSQAAGLSYSYGHHVSQTGDTLLFFNQVVSPHWSLTTLAPSAPQIDRSHQAELPRQSRKNSSVSPCSMHCNLRLPDPRFTALPN